MPPGTGRGAGDTNPSATDQTASTHAAQSIVESTPAVATVDGWERRRAVTKRLVPLACGCRDPWLCRCHRRRSR